MYKIDTKLIKIMKKPIGMYNIVRISTDGMKQHFGFSKELCSYCSSPLISIATKMLADACELIIENKKFTDEVLEAERCVLSINGINRPVYIKSDGNYYRLEKVIHSDEVETEDEIIIAGIYLKQIVDGPKLSVIRGGKP